LKLLWYIELGANLAEHRVRLLYSLYINVDPLLVEKEDVYADVLQVLLPSLLLGGD